MNYVAELIYHIAEFSGVFAFGVSGAMIAVDRKLDLFGVVFMGVTTALGGGLVRDLMLGIVPPSMFRSYSYLLTSVAASLLVFAAALYFRKFYAQNSEKIEKITNIVDAIGLGLFSVFGARTAIECGYGDNVFFCMFLGMTTGSVGGLLRDVMTGAVPAVFRKRIYAVASLGGAGLYCLLIRFGLHETYSMLTAALCVFAVRMLATKYKWNFPTAQK